MFKKLFLVLFVSVIYIESALANLDVKARTAILQDYYSGEILYEKEADKISYNLKKQIFDTNLDLSVKLHLREFVDRIDAIADQAEDVADRLSIYAIKRQS